MHKKHISAPPLCTQWVHSVVLLLTSPHLKCISFIPSATGMSNLIPYFFPDTLTSGTISHPEQQNRRGFICKLMFHLHLRTIHEKDRENKQHIKKGTRPILKG